MAEQNMEQESSTSCHFMASYSWALLLTLLSYTCLEAGGSGKTDLKDFLYAWHQWHSRYPRAFSDINKKGFMSTLHVMVEPQISAFFILTWHWSVQAMSQEQQVQLFVVELCCLSFQGQRSSCSNCCLTFSQLWSQFSSLKTMHKPTQQNNVGVPNAILLS